MAAYLTALERSDFTTVVRVLDKYVDGGLRQRAHPLMFAVIAEVGAAVTETMAALETDADMLDQFMALLTRNQEGGKG